MNINELRMCIKKETPGLKYDILRDINDSARQGCPIVI